MADTTVHGQSYDAWVAQNSQPSSYAPAVTLEFLRKNHPGHHVTRTTRSGCDLMGFANAGFATATRDSGIKVDSTRVFYSSDSRFKKQAGELLDDPSFCRWSYTWENKGFIVYEVACIDRRFATQKLLFVLSPISTAEQTLDIHHPDTDALLLAVGLWSKEVHNEIQVYDGGSWNNDHKLWKGIQGTSWDDVILHPDMKETLIQDTRGFFDNREMYRSLKVPWKRGLIFHGLPGNGKTFSIKALINTLSSLPEPVPALYVKSLEGGGGSKGCIRNIFSHARAMAPCLLIFEDLDSMVTERTRSYFLNAVDGLESNDGILMIGSTNHLDLLDPAITKRPSRFDRKYHFKLPGEAMREAYCQFWCRKFVGSQSVDFPVEICPLIAKMTDGFSFAYLQELFIASLLVLAKGSYAKDASEEGSGVVSDELAEKDGSSADDIVVVETASKIDTEEDREEQTGDALGGDAEKTPGRAKRVLPKVETPEPLRGNVLLKIVRTQAKLLLAEMDNSEDEEAAAMEVRRGLEEDDTDTDTDDETLPLQRLQARRRLL